VFLNRKGLVWYDICQNKTIIEVCALKSIYKIVLLIFYPIFFLFACSQTSPDIEKPLDESISTVPQTLTDNDLEQLKKYADTCEIEDAVGQLFMVGLPTDIARYKQDKVIEKIVSEFHIGWVFINTYNYWWNEKTNPLKNDVLSDVANFYNRIQDKAIESGLRIPIGFSANFEGGNYSSIGRILSQSPEALTIASSNDEEIVSKVGSLVGYQLKQLGIHILLGPVVDVDSTSAREFVTRTQNRIFAGTPDLVTNIASHYLSGIRQNGLIVIAKHFPGYGDVSENPHNNEMPESRDSFEGLESNLIPYKSLESNIDGVMTAHMSINILDPNRSKIVTFSPVIVNDLYRKREEIEILKNKTLAGLNYGDKVAITDDLADMGAIRKYMNSNNFGWDDIVIQAFDAGHDILLFSVMEKDKNDSNKFSGFGDFDIDKLEEILNNFIEYIKSSKDNEKRFRTSLYRNLILKAKIAKFYDQSVGDFLHGVGMERWRLGVVKDEALKSIPVGKSELRFEDPDLIVDEALKAGYLEINKVTEWNLKNAPANLKVSIFTDNSIDNNDEELLKHNFSNIMFYKIRRQKTEEQYRGLYRQLVSSLESDNKIYFAVSSQDDANIIKSAYEQHRNLVQQKLIIFVHNTPTLIEANILQGVTVIGCFSTLYASYAIDLDIILGRTDIKPAHYLTISLGSNGSVYDHKKNNFAFSLSSPEYKLIPFYATANEKTMTEKNKILSDENERLNTAIKSIISNSNKEKNKYVIIIVCLLVFIIINLFFNYKNGDGIISFFSERFGGNIKGNILTRKNITIGVISTFILVMIWCFLGRRYGDIIKLLNSDISKILIICAGILICLLLGIWHSIGRDFMSSGKEPLKTSEIIFCAAYRYPKRIFAMIGIVLLVILIFFKFPNSLEKYYIILNQNEVNKVGK
jgi:beta-N-acetylhexosaminidase